MARYRVLSGNWNLANSWSTTSGGTGGASVPSSLDDVFFDSNTPNGTTTLNISGSVNSIDFTGFTGTLAGAFPLSVNANLTFGSGMTITHNGTIRFDAISGTNTIKFNGKTYGSNLNFEGNQSGTGGTWQFLDTINANAIGITAGTLDANNQNVTTQFASLSSFASTLLMGSGTWNVTGWSVNTNITINPGTSTIKMNQSISPNFAGGGLTYYNLHFVNDGAGSCIITYSDTYNQLILDPGITLLFEDNNITISSINARGTSVNMINILPDIPDGAAGGTISCPSGIISCDYLSLTDIIADGGATFYAGINSVDNGGNSGWIFTNGPLNLTIPSAFINLSAPVIVDSFSITRTIPTANMNISAPVLHESIGRSLTIPSAIMNLRGGGIVFQWNFQQKHTSSWNDVTKHTTSWIDSTKHSSSWNNQTKH